MIQICTEALQDVIGAIEWDIEEVITISTNDVSKVLCSDKFRKILSTKIMDSIQKNLNNRRRK